MFYIESPDERGRRFSGKKSVFMAGGITDCPDWQREMRDHLINTDIVLYNPRRANFPIDDPDAAEAQIAWEHKHLHEADAVMFWFPCETMCPIVLFELGAWSHHQTVASEHNRIYKYRHKPIFVGAHPEYERRQDVVIQMKLQCPDVVVVESLHQLAGQIDRWADTRESL